MDTTRVLTCIQCGKCTGSCPESGKTPFNIRMVVRKKQFEYAIEESLPWYCTSCNTCTLRCPRDVKPSEVIVAVRAGMVEDGRIPVTIQKALENTFVQRNPWGRARSKRGEWLGKAGFEIPHVSETEEKRLLFTCCIQAYDPRCTVIPTNVAGILHAAGVEFGALGEEEACCGNEIRRIGEAGLFEELQEENLGTFTEAGVREIVALSPHCMNTLKKEYGDTGIAVRHYTEIVDELMREGRIVPARRYEKKVIYHDPCFLGKQNGLFDAPRRILDAVLAEPLMEFARCRDNSLCCEGGGGRMFFDVEAHYQRNAEVRVAEAAEKGAEVIATACPFCLMTLEDQAKEKGIEVKELSEILGEVV